MKTLVKVELVILLVCFVSQCYGTYTATYTQITSSAARKWLDVSKMADGKIAVSNTLSNRGKIYTVQFNPLTGGYITGADLTFDVGTSADGLSYNGNTGTEDQFYVTRNYNVTGVGYGHIERWGTVSGLSTILYNQGSAILGIDLINAGDPSKVVFASQQEVATYDFSTSTKTSIIATGSTYFSGVSSLGDINADGKLDFVASATASSGTGQSDLYTLISTGTSYSLTAISGTGVGQTIWTGVTNMGDIDGDGFVELVACKNWRTLSLANEVGLIQTNILVPEPATIGILLTGLLGLRISKRKKSF
jgi:hypothetical protein